MEFPEGPPLRPTGEFYISPVGFLDFYDLFALSIIVTLFIIGFLTGSIFWIWGMLGAYRLAKGINQKIAGNRGLISGAQKS
jgi:hypothetical protein